MRPHVLVASITLHAALGFVLVSLSRPAPAVVSRSVSIEVIASPHAPDAVEPPSTPVAAPPVQATRARSARSPRGGGGAFVDPRGEIRIESAGEGSGTGTGRGDGAGDGIGLGIGDSSAAAALAQLVPPPPPPPEPARVTKARPAILIYPRKHGRDDDPSVFVATVTIDEEGYVVGARVTRGEGGPRGQQASALIWRFRYDPARDDEGRPIASTLEQPFLVGR